MSDLPPTQAHSADEGTGRETASQAATPQAPSASDGTLARRASEGDPSARSASEGDQLPEVNQSRLFQRLRWHLLRNSWLTLVGQPLKPGGERPGAGNWTRPLTILLCSIVVWVFVFGISWGGFWFLTTEVRLPADGAIIAMLLDLLFVALGMLLIFSTGLILYGSLFGSPETAFLLSRPVADDQVFAYKFQGAVAFSSWAFLLLGGPVLIAYGLVCNGPWYFYAFLPLFFLGFVLLPGSLGSLAALLVVNFVPRRRKQVVGLAVAALLAYGGWWVWDALHAGRALAEPGDISNQREAVTRLLDRFTFTQSVLLPTHWVAHGLRRAGQGRLGQALYYLGLVWSNGLFLYLLTAWSARRLYRRGYNRVATGGTLRRRYGGGAVLDRLLEAALRFTRPSTRLLLVKDFRTFRRDPQQWGQIVLFGGLMVLYFTNIRRLFLHDIDWVYQNSISVLNLCAIALLLCTYTGRFVYPLLSLEGRKFWILGLLPVERGQLLWGKFAFATTGGVAAAVALVLLSDLMLDMPADAIGLHAATVTVLAAGLSGLSVGLGACMPNFRETDPSKIAVGFGGTLNLVAGLLYLLLVLGLMAAPWHLQMALPGSLENRPPWLWVFTAPPFLLGLAAGLAGVVGPLHAGIRALERMEF
jgi:ABC-2 type transport system permease protein